MGTHRLSRRLRMMLKPRRRWNLPLCRRGTFSSIAAIGPPTLPDVRQAARAAPRAASRRPRPSGMAAQELWTSGSADSHRRIRSFSAATTTRQVTFPRSGDVCDHAALGDPRGLTLACVPYWSRCAEPPRGAVLSAMCRLVGCSTASAAGDRSRTAVPRQGQAAFGCLGISTRAPALCGYASCSQ